MTLALTMENVATEGTDASVCANCVSMNDRLGWLGIISAKDTGIVAWFDKVEKITVNRRDGSSVELSSDAISTFGT